MTEHGDVSAASPGATFPRLARAYQLLDPLFDPRNMERLNSFRLVPGPDASSAIRVGAFVVRLEEDQAVTRSRSIGARVRAARTRRGWSQNVLAKRSRMARANLARLEGGKHTPLISTLRRIVAALEISLPELLAEPVYRPSKEDKHWIDDGVSSWAKGLRAADRRK